MLRKCRICGREFTSRIEHLSPPFQSSELTEICPICSLRKYREVIRQVPTECGILRELFKTYYGKDKLYWKAIEEIDKLEILESI